MRLSVDELSCLVCLYFFRCSLLKYLPEVLRDLFASLLLDGYGPSVLAEDVDYAHNAIRVAVMTFKLLHVDGICLPLAIDVSGIDPSPLKVAGEGLVLGVHFLSVQESFYVLFNHTYFPPQLVHSTITLTVIVIEMFK